MHASSEEKVMIKKTACMRNWSRFFDHFPKYHMKILFGEFNAKLEGGREGEGGGHFQTDNWE